MRTSYLASALLVSTLMIAPAAFAQQPSSNSTHQSQSTSPTTSNNGSAATRQKTQDPTGQYNFGTPGGQYSSRPGMKQRTDGEDVTGNNNFPAGSK